jgi:hypothetical protein
MKYKPDEGTLIAYLYGELDAIESKKVQEYLNQHPHEVETLQQFNDVKKVMSRVQEKEVIAPPVFGDFQSGQSSIWKHRAFRTWMSIAASFVLILLAGKLIGPEISYSKGELRISFNKAAVKEVETISPSAISANDVQQMINSSLAQNNELIRTDWNENQKKLEHTLKTNFASNSTRINELMKTTSQASQDQVRTFVAGLQEENLKLMKDYLQLTSSEQKNYVEGLLVDFSKYLQEQRKQDFQVFQTRMSSIEKNTDQFKQETEQILANIISNPTGTVRKANNY